MTHWIGYARSGREFRVASAIRRLGPKVRIARRLDAKRVPTRRLPVPVRAPYLPNYLFIEATDEQWHAVHAAQAEGRGALKYLAPTMAMVPDALMDRPAIIADRDMTVRREIRELQDGEPGRLLGADQPFQARKGQVLRAGGINAFLDQLDADYLDRLRRHRDGERIGRYEPGEQLLILEGSLAGRIATLRGLIDAAGFDRDLRIDAEVGSLGGKPLRVRLDPLHVRRVKVAM